MTKKAKLALIAALAVTRLAATPAFAQSFDADDGTGNMLTFTSQSAAPDVAVRYANARATRRNGLDAYAMEPRLQSHFAPRVQMPADFRRSGDHWRRQRRLQRIVAGRTLRPRRK